MVRDASLRVHHLQVGGRKGGRDEVILRCFSRRERNHRVWVFMCFASDLTVVRTPSLARLFVHFAKTSCNWYDISGGVFGVFAMGGQRT